MLNILEDTDVQLKWHVVDDVEMILVDIENLEEPPVEKIHYFKNTIHFKRRKHDRQYEVLALSSGRPDHSQNSDGVGNRWITLAVLPTHDEALKEIKRLRA